jgi:nitrous oxidase accessory protein NosD
MSEFNREIAISITEVKNKILASEDRDKILAHTNELYAIVNNPDNVCNNNFRKETLLNLIERVITNIRNNSLDVKSAHIEANNIYYALLGIYLENSERVKFLRDI